MDTDYWKSSPFGEESIFHPSWEEKREQERQILLSTGKITNVLVTKGNGTIGYGHLIDTKPFDASDPNHKKWIEGISLEDADALLVKDVKEKIPLLERLIKVELLQREYDALLLCLFNGGMGDTLITTINKGVENLTTEEVFKAFLVRRYIKGIESDGLIYRRAREAEIFIYENYHLYPSEKFKDRKAVIKSFKDFLKTGILPIWIVLITILFPSCQSSSEKHKLLKRTQSETCVIDSINEELHIDPNLDTYRLTSSMHIATDITDSPASTSTTRYCLIAMIPC